MYPSGFPKAPIWSPLGCKVACCLLYSSAASTACCASSGFIVLKRKKWGRTNYPLFNVFFYYSITRSFWRKTSGFCWAAFKYLHAFWGSLSAALPKLFQKSPGVAWAWGCGGTGISGRCGAAAGAYDCVCAVGAAGAAGAGVLFWNCCPTVWPAAAGACCWLTG